MCNDIFLKLRDAVSLKKIFYFLMLCIHICMCAYAMAHVWSSEDNFVELLFSFNLCVSSGMGIRLSGLICEFLKRKLYIYFGAKKLEFCNLSFSSKITSTILHWFIGENI